MLVYGSYIQVPNLGVTLFGGYCEAHLFSVPNDCLWYDTLWGPSQRVVTLFSGLLLKVDQFFKLSRRNDIRQKKYNSKALLNNIIIYD